MKIELHGLAFETPKLNVVLHSPWRCVELEHRMFMAVKEAIGAEPEDMGGEVRLSISDPKHWRSAQQALLRVLKGWQEDCVPGTERRHWAWLVEGDVNASGYDHTGQPASLWFIVRTLVERGGPHDGEKPEELDLEGFGIQVEGSKS